MPRRSEMNHSEICITLTNSRRSVHDEVFIYLRAQSCLRTVRPALTTLYSLWSPGPHQMIMGCLGEFNSAASFPKAVGQRAILLLIPYSGIPSDS
ncbi:hypothetical protein DNTS_007749 [Danionella cerebrum]|uniref:Uncharacterized protein n=1 Tax=Danionella cerebrum TaxID=2873325 RepID=A0A553R871_9TELE|nr:hypothetical protein DNTS_007749 [Danionella translucida]